MVELTEEFTCAYCKEIYNRKLMYQCRYCTTVFCGTCADSKHLYTASYGGSVTVFGYECEKVKTKDCYDRTYISRIDATGEGDY